MPTTLPDFCLKLSDACYCFQVSLPAFSHKYSLMHDAHKVVIDTSGYIFQHIAYKKLFLCGLIGLEAGS